MNLLKFYFSPKGRIDNSSYLLGEISLLAIVFSAFFLINEFNSLSSLFPIIISLCVYCSIILDIKRLHDHDSDTSGWLLLIAIIPFGNLYLTYKLLFAAGNYGPNNYGTRFSITQERLSKATVKLRNFLEDLEQNYPNNTDRQNILLLGEFIKQVDTDLNLEDLLMYGCKVEDLLTIESEINHSLSYLVVETVEALQRNALSGKPFSINQQQLSQVIIKLRNFLEDLEQNYPNNTDRQKTLLIAKFIKSVATGVRLEELLTIESELNHPLGYLVVEAVESLINNQRLGINFL